MSAGVRFLITRTRASAPAASNARAVSNSQLVPGNAGINTRGFAVFIETFLYVFLFLKSHTGIEPSAGAVVGNTLSSLPVYAFKASSPATELPPRVKSFAVVTPRYS